MSRISLYPVLSVCICCPILYFQDHQPNLKASGFPHSGSTGWIFPSAIVPAQPVARGVTGGTVRYSGSHRGGSQVFWKSPGKKVSHREKSEVFGESPGGKSGTQGVIFGEVRFSGSHHEDSQVLRESFWEKSGIRGVTGRKVRYTGSHEGEKSDTQGVTGGKFGYSGSHREESQVFRESQIIRRLQNRRKKSTREVTFICSPNILKVRSRKKWDN